ncbi:MAG: hypothetical protein N3A69_08965 [Leptospiraceae bacterium]|nr:hypothetical protein [Leptospiraceae bacterium]
MIFGLEEAFAIGARFFILCILLGIFVTIMEFSKGRNLPYFYSILGFFLGIAIFLIPQNILRPDYALLAFIFFFNFVDIARRKKRKSIIYYSLGLLIFAFFYGIANFSESEEVFTSLFIIGAGLYGYFFYRGLKV